jgi:O-antigen/teichoic acid export membrane protein
MGVIMKQSIIGTAFTYAGVGIGFLTAALVMPRVLLPEQIGLVNVLAAYAGILACLASLGSQSNMVRNFAFFRDCGNNHNGFLGLSVLINFAGFVLVAAIYMPLKPFIISYSAEKSPLLAEYIFLLLPFVLALQVFNLLDLYSRALFNAVLPTQLKEFWQRIAILAMLVAYWHFSLSFSSFVWLYFIALCLPPAIMLISLAANGKLDFRPNWLFLTKEKIRSIADVSVFGLIVSLSGYLLYNIDTIMVDAFLGAKQAGIYSIAFFFGTVVIMPSRMLNKIAATVLSESWKIGDRLAVADIYRKSSINQSIIGCLLVLGLWANKELIYWMLPVDYAGTFAVILLIALANLVEMSSGVSLNILTVSESHRYSALFVGVMIVCTLVLNFLLIPIYGMQGAAAASLISMLVYNLQKLVFLKLRYGLQPYVKAHLRLLAIVLVCVAVLAALPKTDVAYIDAPIRSVLLCGLFITLVAKLNISADMSSVLDKYWHKALEIKRKAGMKKR